jgi:LmbE family N-acetylglucosaminyl deacetylase
MSNTSILAIFAHPDDELTNGGTLARYANDGVRVVLACATRGEAGEISEPHLASRETLGAVRTRELRAAAGALGITDVRFLGFHDSGMAGMPENDDPRSLNRADLEEVVRRVVALIREVRPAVVITHDPTGGYGHPDHIALCHSVTAAFTAAGDDSYAPEVGPGWQPTRLFYGVMTRSFFDEVNAAYAEAGEAGPFSGPEMAHLGYADDAITVMLDVSPELQAKRAGFAAHRTQFGPQSPLWRMSEARWQAMLGREHFVLARPAPEAHTRLTELLESGGSA